MMHFIGIGGIGMSALAWIALEKGYEVSGSDAKESPLLIALRQKGARIMLGQKKENITAPCSVVYSTAIKPNNPELLQAKELGCRLYHRSEILEAWMKGKKQIVIAGAHGKTTTTSLVTHMLRLANLDPSFAIGGISASLGQNGALGKGDYFVAEGDESDGSFLRTEPFISVVTGMDPDHLDYWKEETALDEAYDTFMRKSENLFYCIDDPKLAARRPRGISYGFSPEADIQPENRTLALPGRHNILNSLAVIGVGRLLQIPEEIISKALATFQGVQRRLETKGCVRGVTYVDDYAHHPREVEATLQAIRTKVEKGKLIVVFQPHRFSRFHSFIKEFASALEGEEPLIVTDIYGAGEENIYGVDSQDLIRLLAKKNVMYAKRGEIRSLLSTVAKEGDTVLGMGAGDITSLKEEMES